MIPRSPDLIRITVSVESTGAYPPEDLLPEAIGIMQAKLSAVEESLMKQFSKHAPPARMTE